MSSVCPQTILFFHLFTYISLDFATHWLSEAIDFNLLHVKVEIKYSCPPTVASLGYMSKITIHNVPFRNKHPRKKKFWGVWILRYLKSHGFLFIKYRYWLFFLKTFTRCLHLTVKIILGLQYLLGKKNLRVSYRTITFVSLYYDDKILSNIVHCEGKYWRNKVSWDVCIYETWNDQYMSRMVRKHTCFFLYATRAKNDIIS